jgi:RND superfamily putative drug exporter
MGTAQAVNEPLLVHSNPERRGGTLSPLKPSRNIAARMGRWSASHKKTAIFGWLAFVVAAFVIGANIGTKHLDALRSGSGESGRAGVILADNFRPSPHEDVLVQSKTATVDDPAFRAAVTDVVGAVSAHAQVKNVLTPYARANRGQISRDRHSALVSFELKTTDLAMADTQITAIEKSVADVQSAHPALTVAEFGDASADKALNDAVGKDFAKAGVYSIPLTLGVLIIAFGALLAAGLPVLLALTAVAATMGLVAIPSQFMPVDKDISVLILLIGLAVGVDYSMFYLKREQQERAAGRSDKAALEAAAATSGRAVLISGLTVMVAMAGMFLTGDKTFSSFAVGTILVVGVAILGSLTVLPATLAALGNKVDKLRVPFLHRRRRDDAEGRVWNAILNRVLGRPKISAAVATAALLALAAPALHLHLSSMGPEMYPKDLAVVKTYKKIQNAFPGGELPAMVVIKNNDVTSPQVKAGIAQLEQRALATGRLHEPIRIDTNPQKTVAIVNIAMAGKGADSVSTAALNTLRKDVIPATIGRVPDTEVAVAGTTAQSKDFTDQMKSTAPLVFAFVLAFAFVLLLLSFRSIVIAVKAIVLNLLSVAAAYGVLVLVFQDGWGKSFLGFDYTGGVLSFLPTFLFVILFGLSMDYHVFILSRVREAYDRGMSTEDAVAHGIKSTAAVVTSAALVMVGVFSIFGTLSMIFLKQFGIGLAAAVLIDATIVRAVLLPATMKLLGDWNWYLPRWLQWLPSLEHEPKARVTHDPAPVPA